MFSRTSTLLSTALLSTMLVFSACSESGDSDDNSPARVLDLALEDATISLGDKTLLDVDFSFARDRAFDENRNVVIAVKLPKGVSFVSQSARVDAHLSDNDVNAVRLSCAGGDGELIVLKLGENALEEARDPDGESDARLRMDVRAVLTGVGTGVITARAGYDLVFTTCDNTFSGEELELITVFP